MRVMGFDIRRKPEVREVAQSAPNFLEVFGLGSGQTASGVVVTTESALSVPAIFAAVNFIAGTLAGLPLNLYKRSGEDRQRVTNDPLAAILHDAVNDGVSSFAWRKHKFEQALTGGRGLTFIERDGLGRVMNLWPLDPSKVTIKRVDGSAIYEYREPGRKLRLGRKGYLTRPRLR